jgi:hypothetical protein
MNEQFEVMPFAVAGQHMEQYLGPGPGRFGGRGKAGRSMAGRASSYKAGRLTPPPSSARSGLPRYPRWGSPYRTIVTYPEPYWYRQPVVVPFEPEPFPADWAAEPPMEESKPLPPRLRNVVNQIDKDSTRPQYRWRSTVANVLKKLPREGCAGLYLLVFGPEGRERAYSGESGNLRRRLEEHKRFGAMLGRDISNFNVFIHPMKGSTREQRRALEKAFNTSGLALKVLTNKQAEFEGAMTGGDRI